MASAMRVGCRVASSAGATGSGRRAGGGSSRAPSSVGGRRALRRRRRASASAARSRAPRAPCSTPRACPGTPTRSLRPRASPRPAFAYGESSRPDTLPELAAACWTPCARSTRTRCTTSAWWTCPPSASRSVTATSHECPRRGGRRRERRADGGRVQHGHPRARNSAGFASALWDLRVTLESKRPGCSITVRHRLESLRSASLDVCHPAMRAADAPNPRAPSPTFRRCTLTSPWTPFPTTFPTRRRRRAWWRIAAVAFYRGGQPTAEGRSWMVSRGFKTVVDLRFEDRDNQWTRPVGGGAGVGKLGNQSLEVIHLPSRTWSPPRSRTSSGSSRLRTTRASARCSCTARRASAARAMVSCWRISRGMAVDDALALESLNCDFGSLAQEAFVREFADRLARKRLGLGTTTTRRARRCGITSERRTRRGRRRRRRIRRRKSRSNRGVVLRRCTRSRRRHARGGPGGAAPATDD